MLRIEIELEQTDYYIDLFVRFQINQITKFNSHY